MDYKSVLTNLCLELQQNRSWIKGLGKNPQKSELIHWRQCLLSGGTEACYLGLRETPACIHVIQRLSQPRVACWHGFRKNSQKTECVFTRCPTGGRVNSFTDGSAFCLGAPKHVTSDSAKHRRVYTSSNVCHSHEWRVDTASGKTLKKRNACLHAVRQAVEKKIACIHGLRSEGVKLF